MKPAHRLLLLLVLLPLAWQLLAAAEPARPAAPAASGSLPQELESLLRARVDAALRQALTAAASAPLVAPSAPRPAMTASAAASATASVPEGAASALPVRAGASAAMRPLPPAGAAASSALALRPPGPVACLQTPDQAGDCSPAMQLVYQVVSLPAGREGQGYKPRLMVLGGTQPYRYSVVDGTLPEGLLLGGDGQLQGTPARAGSYNFSLLIRDAATPPLLVRQAYALRIDPPPKPRAPAPAASAASSPPKQLAQIALEDAEAHASHLSPAHLASFVLRAEDLDKVPALALEAPATVVAVTDVPAGSDLSLPAATPAAPAAATAAETARTAPAEQLRDMLLPLLDIEYPTQALFEHALRARRCAYFLLLAEQAARKQGLPPITACPVDLPKDAKRLPAPTSTQPAAGVSPEALYQSLLPAELQEALVDQARKSHDLAGTGAPHWQQSEGCACVAAEEADLTYGLFPFWQGHETLPAEGAASAVPAPAAVQTIRFSLYKRIGYLGVQLNDNGSYVTPRHIVATGGDFIRRAQRFGTRVDLVIQRNEWGGLLAQSQDKLKDFARQAAREAIPLIEARSTDRYTRLREALLPFWGESAQLFDGVTLFFDRPPADPAARLQFKRFYKAYVDELIVALRETGRAHALNLVVPEEELGTEGAYELKQLMSYLYSTRPPGRADLPLNERASYSQDPAGIRVSFLVLLPEPTQQRKKDLRARLDETEEVQGQDRVALLSAMLPVLFHAAASPKAEMSSLDVERLRLDLAYIKWQFGGVGVWTLPLADNPLGKAIDTELQASYFGSGGALQGVCNWACPLRSELRLLWLVTGMVGVVAISLFVGSCRVQRLGRPYIAFLWLGGIFTVLVGALLLSCDPQLAALRAGNKLLFILLAIAVLTGMYFSLKPRTPVP